MARPFVRGLGKTASKADATGGSYYGTRGFWRWPAWSLMVSRRSRTLHTLPAPLWYPGGTPVEASHFLGYHDVVFDVELWGFAW